MKKIKGYKFHTFDELLKKQMKSAEFRVAYKEETARLQIINQIKKTRLAKKYTQKDLAKKSDMSQSVIARIESGKKSFSLSTLSRIAHSLGKDIKLV